MNPTYDFKNQVALITGASTGIGFATAKAFSEAGASVVLVDINKDALRMATEQLTSFGFRAISIICDVTDEAQVATMIAQTVQTFGRLDMAFNNAGVAGPSGIFTDETAEDFDNVNAVNLRGVWACMKHEIKQMQSQGGGAIVNCSSLGGLVGQAGRAAYHATKHGVIGLTISAAVEYANRGIRINCISPGLFHTAMSDQMIAAGQKEALGYCEFVRGRSLSPRACGNFIRNRFMLLTRRQFYQNLHDRIVIDGFS